MNKSMKTLFLVVVISMAIALFWNKVPIIKESVHAVLNPTVGKLLDWSANIGIAIISAIIGLFMTIIQKYTTDQETLRQIKKEQKILQAEMKNYKDQPEKMLEMQKKQFQFIPRTFEITLRPIMYTSIPIIILFRWFNDYFAINAVKVFGFLGWLWAYIILSMIFTTIFRKVFNVA